jgi:hypothetical protein
VTRRVWWTSGLMVRNEDGCHESVSGRDNQAEVIW